MKDFSPCAFVINPSRCPRKARSLARLLEKAGASRVVVTAAREDFRGAVRSFMGSPERYLILFGGDGTVHEALNTLFEAGGPRGRLEGKAIGFIRGGSGNGYHDSYLVPVNLARQLSSLLESVARNLTVEVDLLEIDRGDTVVFGQIAGIGFDAEVLARRKTGARGGGRGWDLHAGLPGYIRAFLSAFRNLEGRIMESQNPYTLRMPGGTGPDGGEAARDPSKTAGITVRSPLIEIGKRAFYGNRFRVCPGAVCDDGLMEIRVFNFETKLTVIANLIPLWLGRHDRINRRAKRRGRPLIEVFKTERLTIHSEKPLVFHVDGELPPSNLAARSLAVTVRPRALSFLVPRRFVERHEVGRA